MSTSTSGIARQRTLLAAITLALTGTVNAEADLHISARPVPGQYIVVLKDSVAAMAYEDRPIPQVAQLAQQLAQRHRMRVRHSYARVLRGFVVQADDAALARLLADDRVAFVEEDGYVSIDATQTGATWGLDRVDQRFLPLDHHYTYDSSAASVHAYVIDTGVLASHTEFTGRLQAGYTAISDGRGTGDCNGHGTHVAGTLAGATFGIAKSAAIHPVRVLDCTGSGKHSGVIAGMDWVATHHVKPAVVNMSLGGDASSSVDSALERLVDAGVTVVVAAGNDSSDACNYSPARAGGALTVGSTTRSDSRSSFSNFGRCLDIFAPGSSITSAWNSGDTAANVISGTSMASPHVAGVAAVYLSNHSTATPAEVGATLIAAATPNRVGNPGADSPNRLLYSVLSEPVSETADPAVLSLIVDLLVLD